MRVSEICVNQIRVNQGLGVYEDYKGFSDKQSYNHPIIIYSAGQSYGADRVSILYICRVLGHLSESITWQIILMQVLYKCLFQKD